MWMSRCRATSPRAWVRLFIQVRLRLYPLRLDPLDILKAFPTDPGSPRNWDQPRSWTSKYPYYDPDEQIASFHTLLPQNDRQYPAIEAASGPCVKKTGHGFISHDSHNWTTTCGLPEHNATDYITASRAVSQLADVVANNSGAVSEMMPCSVLLG
eukprot:COSAG01_NODE_4302_length_5160_cov_16.365936_3_plen_155_part_00